MTETALPPLKTKGPWVGFDLDGTLAEHGKYQGPDHIGTMIQKMKDILIEWLKQGYRVKIMTARMGHAESRDEARTIIQDWLEANGLPRLEVTCKKDYKMLRLYDDRAVQVIPNSGVTLEEVIKILQAENAALKDNVSELDAYIAGLRDGTIDL